jgi:hypothetical protein
MTCRTLFTLAAGSAAALLLSACASPSGPTQNTGQAEMKCLSFVQLEGLAVTQMGKPTAVEGGFRVPVEVQDRLGRRIDNACVIANEQVRWASALPAGLRTR